MIKRSLKYSILDPPEMVTVGLKLHFTPPLFFSSSFFLGGGGFGQFEMIQY